MSALKKILIGSAGLAAMTAIASPAAAQYGYPYGGYGNNNAGGVIGAIIGAIGGGYGQYGYGNYGYNQVSDRTAVSQCAAAVEARLNGYGGGYGQQQAYGYGGQYGAYGNNGYAQPYGNFGGGRVAGITRVERRSNNLKVYGVAMTNATYGGASRYGNNGYGYNQGYGGYNQGYNGGYQVNPDLRFNCKVDRSGRVYDVDIDRLASYNRGDYYYGYRN